MNRILSSSKLIAWACLLGGLVGCASPQVRDAEFSPPEYNIEPPPPKSNGSIYQVGYEVSLYEDVKATRVGDILTIILVEETNASKSADTSTSKNTDVSIPNPTLLGRPVNLFNNRTLETDIGTEQEFSGAGSANQSNSLDGNVTVVVEQVLPNGNLRVRGQKRITINQGDEYVRVSGIVRRVDIRADNTVLSTQVADAHLTYVGRGAVADANSMGWLARFFNSPWWPL